MIWFPIQLQLNQWTLERAESELTYYGMSCRRQRLHNNDTSTTKTTTNNKAIITATNVTPLLITEQQSIPERIDKVRLHGAGFFTNLFENVVVDDDDDDDNVLEEFRSYVLRKNQIVGNNPEDDGGGVDAVGVIENNHRWSFAFGVNDEDPSIGKLLESIGRHSVLQETLEGLLGINPAIIELSTITAEQGAASQGWHFDTSPQEGDSMQYSNTFSDLYSLLIPVQDTTIDMGPTAICPGTHYCLHYDEELCHQYGFSPIPEDGGIWKAGDGLLFNSHLGHQGTAHIEGPTRVAMVISFVSRPSIIPQLPLAAGYVIPWNSMGFTFEDLSTASSSMIQPWSTLRSLGITRQRENHGGWDYFRFCNSFMGNHRDPPQVIVMPYVKLLPIQLIGQANYHDTYSPWQVFVLDTLQRVWIISLIMYLVGLWVYCQMRFSMGCGGPATTATATDAVTSSTKAKATTNNGCPVWSHLLLLHGLVSVVFGFHVIFRYPMEESSLSSSSQARSLQVIENNNNNSNGFSEEYIQSLACPQPYDMLMGHNFLKDVSKWSPGNRNWHTKAKELLPWYLAYIDKERGGLGLPHIFADAVLEALLEDNNDNDNIFLEGGSNDDDAKRRHRVIMMQNEYSDWTELTHEQAKEQSALWLRRMLIVTTTTDHPCNNNAAGRKEGMPAICHYRTYDILVDQYMVNRKAACNKNDGATQPGAVWKATKSPLGILTSHSSKRSQPSMESSTHKTQANQHQPYTANTSSSSFQVGDYVEARPRETTRKWLRATITDKRGGGNLYMVRFDVDIPEYQLVDPLDESLLRPIRPRLDPTTDSKSTAGSFSSFYQRRSLSSQRASLA